MNFFILINTLTNLTKNDMKFVCVTSLSPSWQILSVPCIFTFIFFCWYFYRYFIPLRAVTRFSIPSFALFSLFLRFEIPTDRVRVLLIFFDYCTLNISLHITFSCSKIDLRIVHDRAHENWLTQSEILFCQIEATDGQCVCIGFQQWVFLGKIFI